jgi:hypothetical protein
VAPGERPAGIGVSRLWLQAPAYAAPENCYANSTLSFLPTADAARSKVDRVTDRLAGSNRRSNAGRLVFMRLAISDLESPWHAGARERLETALRFNPLWQTPRALLAELTREERLESAPQI